MRLLSSLLVLAFSLTLCSFMPLTSGVDPTATISNATQAGGSDPQSAQFDFTWDDKGAGHANCDVTFVLKDSDGVIKGWASGFAYTIPPGTGGDTCVQDFYNGGDQVGSSDHSRRYRVMPEQHRRIIAMSPSTLRNP